MEYTNNLVDLSAIIVGLTAVLIYFGKIIADTKVEKYERTDLIISGLFFTLIFILFPVALNMFLYQKGWLLSNGLLAIIVFHLVVTGIYSKYLNYKDIKKFELESEYNARFDKKIEHIKKSKPILTWFIEQRPDIIKQSLKLFDTTFALFENKRILLLLSIALFHSLMITINNANLLAITTVAILAFVNLSIIAITYGVSTAYYPPSKITLTDNKLIEGKIIKFGEFVYIIDKGKKHFINKDQIKIIQQDIMKKK